MFGDLPDGVSINMHPMAFAAWFGLLATALNLFPISQLDGGHISYAVLGRRSTAVTLTMVVVAIGLTFLSSSWIVWTVLMVLMLVAMGPHHPPTLDEHDPLDRGRVLLAVVRARHADRLLHTRADRAVRHRAVSEDRRRRPFWCWARFCSRICRTSATAS